jgi:hypothetical protein
VSKERRFLIRRTGRDLIVHDEDGTAFSITYRSERRAHEALERMERSDGRVAEWTPSRAQRLVRRLLKPWSKAGPPSGSESAPRSRSIRQP